MDRRRWIAGDGGKAFRRRAGGGWQAFVVGFGRVNALWAHPSGVVWAVGDGVARFADGQWTVDDSAPAQTRAAVWGAAPDDVWVAGGAGDVSHLDGERWEVEALDVAGLWALHGAGAGDVWAVGEDGRAFRHDGGAWRPVATGRGASLLAVFARADGVVVAGARGSVLRRPRP